jgi:hypothetical protein
VWWYNTLYQVESVVWTSITTSRDSDELWCGLFTQQTRPDTVLYHHTMYVISLSNISIKMNFNQIASVELKCVQYSEGDYILCMTSRYFFRSFTNVRLLCFVSHSNGMTSCQSSSAENVSCNVAPFFYHHSVVIQHLVSDTFVWDRQLSLISKENVYNVR